MTAYYTMVLGLLILQSVAIPAGETAAKMDISFGECLTAAHSLENLQSRGPLYEAGYPAEVYLEKVLLAGLMTPDQYLLSFDPDEGTMQGLNSHYSLTSNDVQVFFTRSTYGRQFLNGCKIIGGVELGVLTMLMLMPRSFTRWEEDYMQDAVRNLKRAYTSPPVWDQDHWFHNYLSHPYGGSIYYNTVRAQGATPFQSFIFSAFISTAWEYVIEAIAERPSTQDLFITPVVGSVLGELVHQAANGMKKNGCTFPEKVLITVLNPMEVVFNGYR